jgi:diaminohydroxyphosphoribosylaminopyrimidine deaminase/5-amino-6-(5-phosphoribosylamino)uracil reductase
MSEVTDRECMTRALQAANEVRCITSPNPWVGCVIRSVGGELWTGATLEPGRNHAEINALEAAQQGARGGTVYVTLEPCAHHGRTPPCVDALIEAEVSRVVVALEDPDPNVGGRGIQALRDAGIEVAVGLYADRAATQLAPYLHHRRTGRPYVVVKMASTLDGGTAAPDGSSKWITGPEARSDGHRLRAESDAIIVGAGTIRADNPSLNVRDYQPPRMPRSGSVDPRRIVLGEAPPEANVHPCTEMRGDLGAVLDQLGSEGVLQVLVEGGANVVGAFHRGGFVDQYVIYVAPAFWGGDGSRRVFGGIGAHNIGDLWRGEFTRVDRIGDDLRLELHRRPESVGDDR